MTGRPLRAVDGERAAERRPRRPVGRGVALAFAAALVALGLLLWSRAELADRVRDLEAQIATLEQEVAARDGAIDAQRRRFEEVGSRLDELQSRLEGVRALVRESDAE